MRTAYAILGFLFLLVFGGAFFFIGNEDEPERVGSSAQTNDDIPIIADVPKDAIPPLFSPKYDSVAATTWLEDNDIILAAEFGGDARAYPIKIMNWHEIVNDTIGGTEVVVTYCPLCDSGILFDPHLEDKYFTFGNTGSLYESAMVMYDRETESYWHQASGRAIRGELTGQKLTILPSNMQRWIDWKQEHPNGRVLSRGTGYSRNYERDGFAGYDAPDSEPGFPVSATDDRLPLKERIVGIEINGKAKAYPVALAKATTLIDTFEDTTIEIVGDSVGRTAKAFFVENGARVSAPIVSEFWFSWSLSHPETEIYSQSNLEKSMSLTLTSPAFEHNALIPSKYTCDGENINPELHISGVPEGTVSLALVMDDPDIPQNVKERIGQDAFDHWVLYGIDPATTVIPEGSGDESGSGGLSSRKEIGYVGSCPPDREHTYSFRLYALDSAINFIQAPTLGELESAIQESVIEKTELLGRYERVQ